jgi:glycosyltransferase involved in cell wall biosynthesis
VTDVVVSTFTPVLGSGRAVRSYGVVAALALGGPVRVVYQRFGADEPAAQYARLENVEFDAVVPGRGPRRLAAIARARLAGAPLDLARSAAGELTAATARAVKPGDRIVADGPGAALAVLGLINRNPSVYVAHNIEGDLDPRLARLERRLLASFGETWMATRADVRRGLELEPAADLRYAPNVVDVDSIAAPRGKPDGQRALYVADFSYPPNREGLDFLLDAVMPRVWETLPAATIAIAGRGLDLPAQDARVELLGFVDDLGAEYARAAAVVVPLLRGGGSPLKLIEGLAYGRPVVATDHAAALVDGAQPGVNLLAATGDEDFAARLGEALNGKHGAVGRAGRKLAEGGYSINALAAQLQS